MSSIDALGESLSPYAGEMIAVARSSMRHGLSTGEPLAVTADDYPTDLRATGASFVTLRMIGQLRGCVGTVLANRPLIEDVSHNAFMAAFRDPRFDPLAATEIGVARIEISVISPLSPLAFGDEDELAAMLVPGRDGLILEEGNRRGLFLPQVWESLPEPTQFLRYLKEKAGLPAGPLTAGVKAQRFFVAKFEEHVIASPASGL